MLLIDGLKLRSSPEDSVALLVLLKKRHLVRASCIRFSGGLGMIE